MDVEMEWTGKIALPYIIQRYLISCQGCKFKVGGGDNVRN